MEQLIRKMKEIGFEPFQHKDLEFAKKIAEASGLQYDQKRKIFTRPASESEQPTPSIVFTHCSGRQLSNEEYGELLEHARIRLFDYGDRARAFSSGHLFGPDFQHKGKFYQVAVLLYSIESARGKQVRKK
jgi:hypothetical protein